MMYRSPKHHQHQHQQYQSFDSSERDSFYGTMSNGYPVYVTTMEPLPFPEDQNYRYGTPIFNNYTAHVPAEPKRFRVVEYEPAHVLVHAKANKKKLEENVDAEAEKFIQHEHKKFQLRSLRSQLSDF